MTPELHARALAIARREVKARRPLSAWVVGLIERRLDELAAVPPSSTSAGTLADVEREAIEAVRRILADRDKRHNRSKR